MPLKIPMCIEFYNCIVRAVSLQQHGFLISDRSNAEITHCTPTFTAMTQHHGDSQKCTAHDQNHGKSHSDREYVITLQREQMLQ